MGHRLSTLTTQTPVYMCVWCMYGEKYVGVCTHSRGEGGIGNRLNFDIYFYFVVLSLGNQVSVDNLRIQVVSKIHG